MSRRGLVRAVQRDAHDAILRHRGIDRLIVYGVTTPVVPGPAE